MWPNLLETADLVTFAEEILNGKLHFLCSLFIGWSGEFVVIVMLIFWTIYDINGWFVRHKILLVKLTFDRMIDLTKTFRMNVWRMIATDEHYWKWNHSGTRFLNNKWDWRIVERPCTHKVFADSAVFKQ